MKFCILRVSGPGAAAGAQGFGERIGKVLAQIGGGRLADELRPPPGVAGGACSIRHNQQLPAAVQCLDGEGIIAVAADMGVGAAPPAGAKEPRLLLHLAIGAGEQACRVRGQRLPEVFRVLHHGQLQAAQTALLLALGYIAQLQAEVPRLLGRADSKRRQPN